jgi:hypothetical protein
MFELNCTWDSNEIERRKQNMRDVWNYKRIEHIPMNFTVWSNPKGYTPGDYLKDGDRNLEVSLRSLQKTIELIPDDYIPVLKPDKGYPIIAQIYGAPIKWGDKPDDWPGIAKKIINNYDDLRKIKKPDVNQDGWGPELRNRVLKFKRIAKNKIYLTGYDIAGPFIIAHDLMETNLFFLSMKENLELLHNLLEKITETYNEFTEMIVDAAGGLDSMTCIQWDTLWAPEGHKGYLSDDLAVMISPDDYDIFCKPYNNKHFTAFGGGTIHNCGPHYMADRYMTHTPHVKSLNCDYEKSKKDFKFIGEVFAGKANVSVFLPGYSSLPDESMPSAEITVEYYKRMMEDLLPGTIGILEYMIDDSEYSDEDIIEIWHMLRKVSEEYAQNLNWPNN